MSATTARKYEFKKVDIMEDREGRETKIGDFVYVDLYRQIVTAPAPNGQGISADDTIKAIEALTPIKEAKKRGDAYALLDKDSYDFFIGKLNTHRFGLAHEVVAEYVKYCRDLPKVELEEKAADKKAEKAEKAK